MAREGRAEGHDRWPQHSFNACTFEQGVHLTDAPDPISHPESAQGCSVRGMFNSCTFTVVDERKMLLDWLSPLEPGRLHRALAIGRVTGVGDWLLLTNQFTQWREGGDRSAKSILFCYGDPGVGKTYLRYG